MNGLFVNSMQQIIDEWNAEHDPESKKKKKKKKTKIIKVKKFDPTLGFDVLVEVETTDSGTFEEMFNRYRNDYSYYCAMFPLKRMPEWELRGGRDKPFKLFPDKKKAEEELEKNPSDYPYGGLAFAKEYILEQNPHLNPLRLFSKHVAWIDLETNCILVENAA